MKIFLILLSILGVVLAAQPKNPGFLWDTIVGTATGCRYRCRFGTTPVANPNYVKTANGCGSKGLIVDPQLLPNASFEKCCNDHDYCYSTCNANRDKCDTDFWNCMKNSCSNSISFNTINCRSTSDSFYLTVKSVGCSSYLDAQKLTCKC